LNFSDFKKRKIAVDWALHKDAYITRLHEEKTQISISESFNSLKSDEPESDPTKVTEMSCKHFSMASTKAEIPSEEKQLSKEKRAEIALKNILLPRKNKSNEINHPATKVEEEVDSEATLDISKSTIKTEIIDEETESGKEKQAEIREKPVRQRKIDTATTEGRVIFLRNIPFDATDDTVREEASKYGEVSLAIMCKYAETGLQNGSAFVHFKEKGSADSFLQRLQLDEILINTRRIYGHRAVSRSDAESFKKTKAKLPKDKRNLYLLRASLIRQGTSQANEMSENDAKLRERLALVAKAKLKNLLMFISPYRLVIHNIPFSYDDEKLRSECIKAAECKSSDISECKIMCHKTGETAKGRPILGKSMGFGFVTLKNHNIALYCLQKMNNIPTIFTNERRPIVEFSVESLQAVRIKEKRMNNSKLDSKTITDDDLIQTKRKLMAGGMKSLPKKLGPKNRRKNITKNTRKRRDSMNNKKVPTKKSKS